jgi:hypothetical protein
MDSFFITLGFSVLIQVLQELGPKNKYRRAFLKLFRLIAMAYRTDQEFADAAQEAKMLR